MIPPTSPHIAVASDSQTVAEQPGNSALPPQPLRIAPGFWGDDLDRGEANVSWLFQGYLARGHVTLLTSQWKSGKTTLLSILLGRMKEGGELAGLPVARARALIVSEEPRLQWQLRYRKLGLAHVFFLCRPFLGVPTLEEWQSLVVHLARLRDEHGFDLVAIDTLASLLPWAEGRADTALRALLPLQRLTQAGACVLLTHHPRKGLALAGQAARGSGAFPAFADITVEMALCPSAAAEDNRRRRLLAFSRFETTPRHLVVELNAAGDDYAAISTSAGDDFLDNWHALRMALEDAEYKLDRRQILENWPVDFPKPSEPTLWRWLSRAAGLGLVSQQGSGRKSDPFRYWLPYAEEQFRALHPGYDLSELADANWRDFLAKRDAEWGPQRKEPGKTSSTDFTDSTD